MKPHKHAELIKAWADGAEIEVKHSWNTDWLSADIPSWSYDKEYRIKPELTVRYCFVMYDSTVDSKRLPGDNLKLTWHGDKLVGAEVL